jgi:hypothetical protein
LARHWPGGDQLRWLLAKGVTFASGAVPVALRAVGAAPRRSRCLLLARHRDFDAQRRADSNTGLNVEMAIEPFDSLPHSHQPM